MGLVSFWSDDGSFANPVVFQQGSFLVRQMRHLNSLFGFRLSAGINEPHMGKRGPSRVGQVTTAPNAFAG
jgi:hypothetical protein